MSDNEAWTIEVKGPDGVKTVKVPAEAVQKYVGATNYVSAAWLAGWALERAATDGS
jgi:hypothetical protein